MTTQNKSDRPKCTVTRNREPNLELMAKAFLNLYYRTKDKTFIDLGRSDNENTSFSKQNLSNYKISVTYNDDPNAPSFKQIVESKEYKEIVKRLLIKYGK